MSALDRHEMHISVTGPAISGYFAVMYWWNTEYGEDEGFWEPYQTGVGRYATKDAAIAEGKAWAEAEELEFIL